MRMEFCPAPAVQRTMSVKMYRSDENWTNKDDNRSFDEVMINFIQNEHTLTLKRIIAFGGAQGTKGRIVQIFNLEKLPIWLNDVVVIARTALFVKITGRSERFSPIFPQDWTDEKRRAYFKQQMENAVYAVVQGDMTREQAEKEYELDYTIEAGAAMHVSDQENVYMQAEIDRLSILVEGLEAENKRLRDVEEVNDRLSALVATKLDEDPERTNAIKEEVTRLGIRCYSRLRQINQLVNQHSLNRSPYVPTDDLTQLLDNWNVLGARRIGGK